MANIKNTCCFYTENCYGVYILCLLWLWFLQGVEISQLGSAYWLNKCRWWRCLSFLSTFRRNGRGDGEPRNGGSPRETEASAETQRALPLQTAGVSACDTHKVTAKSFVDIENMLLSAVGVRVFSSSRPDSLSLAHTCESHTYRLPLVLLMFWPNGIPSTEQR